MSYRKLTESETKMLLGGGRDYAKEVQQAAIKKFLETFYPKGACKVRYEVASEYNDSTYDNRVTYVAVIGADGREVNPILGKEKAARSAMLNLPFTQHETNDPIEEVDVLIQSALPELYVKEA